MGQAYQRAYKFASNILNYNYGAEAVPFEMGPIRGTANFHLHRLDGDKLGLQDAGPGLQVKKCSVAIGDGGRESQTTFFISIGGWAGVRNVAEDEASLFFFVHDEQRRKLLQVDLQPFGAQDSPAILWATPWFPFEGGPELLSKVLAWIKLHGLEVVDQRIVLGSESSSSSVAINLIKVALVVEHVLGLAKLKDLVDDLPSYSVTKVTFDPVPVKGQLQLNQGSHRIRFAEDQSELLPPVGVRFRVDAASVAYEMWTAPFGEHGSVAVEGQSLSEACRALELDLGDLVVLQPVAPGHYRMEKASRSEYGQSIFIRLGQAATVDGQQLDGFATIEAYQHDMTTNGLGATWFSTDCLASGIKPARMDAFRDALIRGDRVRIYFMIGKGGGGTGRIEYVADLMDLASDSNGLVCPEPFYPRVCSQSAKVWLKLTNLKAQQIPAEAFVVDELGTNLADVVAKSAYMFGYVRRTSEALTSWYSEEEVVRHIEGYLQGKGFLFNSEVVRNYWIGLKTKPFIILAGLSGSGKSKLPMLVAEAIGADFISVAVSPGWTDDTDLLGYANPLGDSRFRPTAFTQFMLQAIKAPDKLWFVCLDEMNLARVEHYFAKFLSAMEGLREADRQVHLHDGVAQDVPTRVLVPRNFLFTGTVNMDETTHSFSPKVLDRANLIEFDITPDELLGELPEVSPIPPIKLSSVNFRSFCRETGDVAFRTDLVDLARVLQRVNAHFGFRVREEIERYIANGTGLLEPRDLLDLQVHQKLLPKLRGSGERLQGVLWELYEACESKGLHRSAAKAQEMWERLRDDGITSFYR